MKDRWVIGFLTLLALAFMLALGWQIRDRVLAGRNDFLVFYTGARLAGTPDLFDGNRQREIHKEAAGISGPSFLYIRPPFFAGLLWPLGRLPYRVAYLLWQLLAVAALVGFICVWRPPGAPLTAMYTCLCFPAFASLFNGTDASFLLLSIALAARWHGQGRGLLAGLVFALCAAKFHLFLLLPLLIWGQRMWRFGCGLLAGGLLLLAASFAAAGRDWPWQYYATLTRPQVHPDLAHMPNLHGLFSMFPAVAPFEWVLAAGVAIAVGVIARRASFEYALAATLAGGLLVSYHAYVPDCSLMLPAALVAATRTTFAPLRVLAVALLMPFAYLMVLTDPPWPAALPLAVLGFLALMTIEAWRSPPREDQAPFML